MTQQKRPKRVKVGDVVELDKTSNGLAVLPDGTVVTCRNSYTVQHAGRHTLGGVEYDAVEPRATKATDADPAGD